MLRKGFTVLKDGNQRTISLTQPQMIAEIITYSVGNEIIDFDKKRGVIMERGEELLHDMGYQF